MIKTVGIVGITVGMIHHPSIIVSIINVVFVWCGKYEIGIMNMTNQPDSILSDMREALREEYKQDRGNSVHVSDIIYCPRESVFRRLRSHELSDKELMFFATGQSYHQILQSLLRWLGKQRVKIEKKVTHAGVQGHIDAVIDGIPHEFKSHRSREHSAKPHYVQQLKCYISMLGSNVGKIVSIGLIRFDDPFKEFVVTMTDSEMKAQLDWIEKEGKSFLNAVEKKDWKLARAVKQDENLNWKCDHCVFQKECFDFENTKKT